MFFLLMSVVGRESEAVAGVPGGAGGRPGPTGPSVPPYDSRGRLYQHGALWDAGPSPPQRKQRLGFVPTAIARV